MRLTMTDVPQRPELTFLRFDLSSFTRLRTASETRSGSTISPDTTAFDGVGQRANPTRVAPRRDTSTSASLMVLVPMSRPRTLLFEKNIVEQAFPMTTQEDGDNLAFSFTENGKVPL